MRIIPLDVMRIDAYNGYMNSKELIKILKQNGWELDRTKGSHHVFKHPNKSGHVVVPHPKKDFPLGTLRNILKQAGLKLPR